MKTTKNLFALFFSAISFGFPSENPPQPQADIPSGPGLPIDSGIVLLLIVGVIFGAFVLIKKNKTKTA